MNNTATEYLGCAIGGTTIAVAVHFVQEVFETKALTRVPGCPDFITGMVNVRGSIVPVINLEAAGGSRRSTAKIVVLNSAEGQVGLLVSEIIDLINFDAVAPASEVPPLLSTWGNCLEGMADHDGTYFLLNVDQLIAGTISRTAEATPTT